MRFISRITALWRNLTQEDRVERDLDEELRAAHDILVAEKIAAGLLPAAARRAASIELGGSTQIKERVREARTGALIDSVSKDFQYAARGIRREPGFAAAAIATLALGIGANTAVFSLVDRLLLRPLPVSHPEQLVLVSQPSHDDLPSFMFNHPMWAQLRQRPQLFAGVFGHYYSRFNLASGGETELVDGLWASGGFFETLGVPAILGRTFTDADDQRGGGSAGPVAVISHGFWQRRFGGQADVVGRTLTVERVPFTIVGVLPAGFHGPVAGRRFDIAIPIGVASLVSGPVFLDNPGAYWITIMARLKPGQTLAAATVALQGVQPQLREASRPPPFPGRPDEYLKNPLTLLPAGRGNPLAPVRVGAERPLWTMQLVVALVLLIACANIANLMLARAAARRHEMSLRLALGASRFRLSRQLFVESLLLSSIGAAAGFLLAQWGTPLLVRMFAGQASELALDLAPDARILFFTAGIAVASSLLFGVGPARHGSRVEPIESLKEQGAGLAGTRVRLASGLVVVEVALSLVLVVGGGLLVRTFANLATMDLGFDPHGVLVVDVGAGKATIPAARRLVVFDQVRQAVAAVPGIAGAAIADITPLTGGAMAGDVEVLGVPLVRGRGQTFVNRIGPGWLSLYGTPVLAGRDFTDADRPETERVAIVNRTFARQFLGGTSPVGHVIRQIGGSPGRPAMEWKIVGMVADAVYESLRSPVPATMYWAFGQIDPELLAIGAAPMSASLSVRSAGRTNLTRAVAAAIAGVNPDLDLSFQPLPDAVSRSIALERTLAILSGFFGGLSLLLAAVGLYGITSYAVNRRRREIGIRMALGATPTLVVWQVLSGVLILVGIGVVIGAGVSFWAAQFVATLLYGLQPRDPSTLIAAIVLLATVGFLAGWLPAWRAARFDPIVALRHD